MSTPTITIGARPGDDSRKKLAEALMRQGVSTAPVGHWTQALARIMQAYTARAIQDEMATDVQQRKQAARDTLTEALSAYRGDTQQTIPVEGQPESRPGGATVTVPGAGTNRQALLDVLAGNPDTADFANQYSLSQILSGGDFKVPSGYMRSPGGGIQQIPGWVNTSRYKPYTYTDEGGNLINALVDVGQFAGAGRPGAGTPGAVPGTAPGGAGAPQVNPDGTIRLGTGKEKQMTVESGSKAAMMQQGMRDLKSAQPLLFPDGQFDRTAAASTWLNLPGTDGRLAYSYYFNALNAKLRAESGAAVPEEEVKRGLRTFMPSPLDNDRTAQEKHRRLHQFMATALINVDPTGRLVPADAELAEWMAQSEQKTREYLSLPRPKTQADYDKLPAGSRFVNTDGQVYMK